MVNRRISLMLAVVMMLTLMIPRLAFGAVDYSGHWAEETIQDWFDEDKLQGYEDGTFRPDAQITRAEFMTMVNNSFGFTEKATISFDDVDSDDWYYPEVQKAVKAGYLIGYEDNTARPGNKISRQEAALIIARIKELSDNASGANIFNDASQIATWAKGGVGAIAKAKFMIGYEDNTFRPLKYISRAEALVTIDRSYEKTEEPTTPPSTGGGGNGDYNPPATITTAAAITSIAIDDGIQGLVTIATPSAITTEAAIIASSAESITISAITLPTGANIAVKVTSPTADVITSTAIGGEDIVIELSAIGDYTIQLTVSSPKVGNTMYTDTTYIFMVNKFNL